MEPSVAVTFEFGFGLMKVAELDKFMKKRWPDKLFAKDLAAWLPSFATRTFGHRPLECVIMVHPKRHWVMRLGSKVGISVLEASGRYVQSLWVTSYFFSKLKPRPAMTTANLWSEYLVANVASSLFLGRGLGDIMGLAFLGWFDNPEVGTSLSEFVASKKPGVHHARTLLYYGWPAIGDRLFTLSSEDLQRELANVVIDSEVTVARATTLYNELKDRFPF